MDKAKGLNNNKKPKHELSKLFKGITHEEGANFIKELIAGYHYCDSPVVNSK